MTTVFDVLVKEITEERTSVESAMLSGAAKEYPAYRELVGIRVGLIRAEELVKALARKQYEEDPDD